MKQKPIRTATDALIAGGKAETGATLHGVAIGLKHNTATVIGGDRAGLTTAINNEQQGKLALATQFAAMKGMLAMIIMFLTIARDVLKAHLGIHYSNAWDAVGLVGSLMIPRTADRLRIVLERMVAYLEANPALQNEALNVKIDSVRLMLTELIAMQQEVSNKRTALKNLQVVRRQKVAAMIERVGNLFKEAQTLLDPLDMRWIELGFNRPGAERIADVPMNIIAVLVGASAISIKWDAAPRAQYYRIWKRVIGVDAEWIAIGNSADRDFTLEGLPASKTVEIAVSAVNSGGESERSTVVSVVTNA
jgi:hypothetical protein